MTQRDTRRQEEGEKKDSSTRPLLLGPSGARGRASPLTVRLMRSPTGWPHFPPAARQPGRRPHGQRQTDRLTEALKQERIAFLYKKKKQHTRQTDKDRGEKRHRPPEWKTGTGGGVKTESGWMKHEGGVSFLGGVFEMEGWSVTRMRRWMGGERVEKWRQNSFCKEGKHVLSVWAPPPLQRAPPNH